MIETMSEEDAHIYIIMNMKDEDTMKIVVYAKHKR